MATEASLRRKALALRLGMEARAVEAFLIEFNSMRKIMRQNLKGMDIDAMEANPDAPMQTASAQMASERKNRKVKSSRGGGGGFSKN